VKSFPEDMSEKKTVLFAIDALYGGGAEKVLIYILERLDRRKFSIDLFLFTRSGDYVSMIPPDVNVVYLFEDIDKTRNQFIRFLKSLRRSVVIRLLKVFPWAFAWKTLPRSRYDVGISFCEGMNLLLFSGAKDFFLERISWIHSDVAHHAPVFGRAYFERQLRSFNNVVFVSHNALHAFERVYPEFPTEKLRCIYNPIDVSGIIKSGAEPFNFPTKKGISNGAVRIVSVGRFMRVKRFDRLLNVIKRLVSDGRIVEVFIIGEGWEKVELERLIDRLEIGHIVRLIPFQKNPYVWMKNADIFVSSSDCEGAPLVVLEALILGTPIVATRTAGSKEILQDGKYGELVDISEEGLYVGLRKLLEDSDERKLRRTALGDALKKGLFPFGESVAEIENLLLGNGATGGELIEKGTA
jgi:glycosyltransferase involved in cell wall biosynthesis